MALIDNRAQVIEDFWTYTDSGYQGGISPNYVIPFGVLATVGSEDALERPLGVLAGEGITAHEIAPFLGDLDLVVVAFPKFRDGRGFTVARTLREKHGFKGDIRAIGHLLPDQFPALVLCGFSTIVTPPEHPPSQWRKDPDPAARLSSGGPLLRRLIGERKVAGSSTEKNG